jgi:glycopeptide antibiotics resistance protein
MVTAKLTDPFFPSPKGSRRILGVGALIICAATLSPFDFTNQGVSISSAFGKFISRPGTAWDLIGNVYLFMPFGFGLSTLLKHAGIHKIISFAIVLLTSAAFSFGIETLQLFLPSRFPSWVDVLTNTGGGLAGYISFLVWSIVTHNLGRILNQKLKRTLTAPNLALSLIGWVLIMSTSCMALQNAAHLSNWDLNYPFILGNERTGDRPWEGTVSLVEISDRALPESEIAQVLQSKPLPQAIAAYSLTGADYRDRTGQLPELVWQGNSPKQTEAGATLSAQHWLSTPSAAAALSEKLRKTSEFTIHAIAATSSLVQEGPGRILSLSDDPMHRNFTLGQDKDQLIFRLRTPVTGENGVFTALFVSDVFRDVSPHHFLLRYRDNILRLYIDRTETVYSLELTPEITLFRYLFPFEGRTARVSKFSVLCYRVFFYMVFFIPLGLILGLILAVLKGQLKFYTLLITFGLVVPAFLLEFLLRNGHLRFGSLTLSIAIALVTAVLAKGKFNAWFYSVSDPSS